MSMMVAVALGLAAVWSLIALHMLSSAIGDETAGHLARAAAAFDSLQRRTADELRTECRMLAADPRIAAALARPAASGASAAPGALISELAKLRRTGILVITGRDGRVLAQSGVDELDAVDLSQSRIVSQARTAPDALADAWVIGDRLLDVAIAAVRSDSEVAGYLVIGQEVDRSALDAVAEQTGVATATAIGDTITVASPRDVPLQVVAAAAGRDDAVQDQRIELHGESYLVSVSVIAGPDQAPRLILARSIAPARAAFAAVKRMLYAPSLLVLIAALLAMCARRWIRTRLTASPPSVIAAPR